MANFRSRKEAKSRSRLLMNAKDPIRLKTWYEIGTLNYDCEFPQQCSAVIVGLSQVDGLAGQTRKEGKGFKYLSLLFISIILLTFQVVEFCTEKNHNKEAPNLQNQKCNLRSTWEVISDSEDFKKTTPMTTQPPTPTFSLLQIGQRIVCLVLDKSGSMAVCSLGLTLLDSGLTFAYDMIWTAICNKLGINTTLRVRRVTTIT